MGRSVAFFCRGGRRENVATARTRRRGNTLIVARESESGFARRNRGSRIPRRRGGGPSTRPGASLGCDRPNDPGPQSHIEETLFSPRSRQGQGGRRKGLAMKL